VLGEAMGQIDEDRLFAILALLFPVFWCAVLWLIARLGGWRALAVAYPDRQAVDEAHVFRIEDEPSDTSQRQFRWQSLTMGPQYFPTNYGSCVNVDIGERGVRLRVSLPFRLFHAPVLLPWSAIEGCESQRVMLFWTRTKVALRDRPHPIYFSGKGAEEIQRVWNEHAERSTAT
jgi:hypothetical protein